MSVITPLVDTLLQNVLGRRADLDRVAAKQPELPLNGITPTSPQRDTGSDTPDERLERRSELSGNNPRLRERGIERSGLPETAAQTGASRYASQEASAKTHLSAEARVIARILERFPDGAQRITAGDALLASGERPEAARLATALAGQLRHSGLFYESHLSQWLGGKYELSALLKEPQAQLSTRNALLLQQMPDGWAAMTAVRGEQVTVLRESVVAARSGSTAQSALAAQSGSTVQNALAAQSGSTVQSALAAQSGSTAQSALAAQSGSTAQSALAAQSGSTAQSGLAAQSGSAVQGSLAAQSALAAQGGSTVQSTPAIQSGLAAQSGEPVHESLHGVVRHQLEVTTQPLLRMEGFFWPEVPFQWEVERDAGESASEPEEDELRTWRSRLQLTMPNLGELDIDVRLRGNELYITGRVDPAALTRVTLHGERLVDALQAAGLSVAALNFSPRAPSEEGQA